MPLLVCSSTNTSSRGGTILNSILKSANTSLKASSISVTVRRQDQADALSALGVTPIFLKDIEDSDFLTKTAEDFDIVIHSTNGFHVPSAVAIINGLGNRKDKTGATVHYIHNSGTSDIANQPFTGIHVDETPRVFSDKDDIYGYEKMREAKEAYVQRTVDIAVVETGLARGVTTYVLMSPLVFGRGTGLFHKASIQLPLLINNAVSRGEATYVGDGSNVWDHTHVEDMGAMFALFLSKIVAGEKLQNGKEGFYFVNGGRHTWKDIAEGIAAAGVQLGKLNTKEPKSITLDEASQVWLGGNKQLAELGFSSR